MGASALLFTPKRAISERIHYFADALHVIFYAGGRDADQPFRIVIFRIIFLTGMGNMIEGPLFRRQFLIQIHARF